MTEMSHTTTLLYLKYVRGRQYTIAFYDADVQIGKIFVAIEAFLRSPAE